MEALKIDAEKKQAVLSGTDIVIKEGDIISIDGMTGEVMLGAVKLVQPEMTGDLGKLLSWADKYRTRWACVPAPTKKPGRRAASRDMGAEGIGLCRTEHMFLGDRKQISGRHDPLSEGAAPNTRPRSTSCMRRNRATTMRC